MQTHKPPQDSNGDPVKRSSAAIGTSIGVVIVLIALAVGAYALLRLDSWGDGSADTPQRFQLDLAAQMEVPAELLAYREERRFDVSLQEPTAITTGHDGSIYVAGDTSIEIFQPDGSSTIAALESQPSCMAVGLGKEPNAIRLYVGTGRRIAVLNEAGGLVQQWPQLEAKSVLTGIATTNERVFVADAGQRIVLQYNLDGELVGTIGQPDPDREMPGFVIPSPYFDLVTGRDEVLHIVNPGMRRVEAYNYDGELQSYWGKAGSALPDFFGCCNPAHLALTLDGQFVTSEKGVPRVKVYTAEGDLLHVVAGPKQLNVPAAALGDARGNQNGRIFDVSVDSAGRVLVLDAHHREVIVFARHAGR